MFTIKENKVLKPVDTQTSKEFLESMKNNKDWLEFWKVLRAMRVRAGLTQTELGNLTGVNQVYISMLECGRVNPTIKTVFKIAEVLNAKMNIQPK